MANITNRPIQNIWASNTNNIQQSSNADNQGIIYGSEIISDQLNGALNTLSNQVAFSQYNGGQYSEALTYNVGNVVSLYYRNSQNQGYNKILFKCINDSGGNGITNISPITNGTQSIEGGITFITGGTINTAHWQLLAPYQSNVVYHSSNTTTISTFKPIIGALNGGGVKGVYIAYSYLFSLPSQLPTNATIGNPCVITEKVRIKWNNNLQNLFNTSVFTNFKSGSTFSFNNATNDTHDYILTIEAKYNENGALTRYDLSFSDFNCNISLSTIPTFLTMGTRSAAVLSIVKNANYYTFNIVVPKGPNNSACGSITATFLTPNTILQSETSQAVSSITWDSLNDNDNYKIGVGLGTQTKKRIGEIKYTNQPACVQEDGWYDLAILTEVEKFLCNGGVYNTNGTNGTTINTNGATIPFNPVNSANNLYQWLLLSPYMIGGILTDEGVIFARFRDLAQEGARAIGTLSINNYLDPTNITHTKSTFTEIFENMEYSGENGTYQQSFYSSIYYGNINYMRIALSHYNANAALSSVNVRSQGGLSYPGMATYVSSAFNYFLADPSNKTNSSYSAPASIYCSLCIRVG